MSPTAFEVACMVMFSAQETRDNRALVNDYMKPADRTTLPADDDPTWGMS